MKKLLKLLYLGLSLIILFTVTSCDVLSSNSNSYTYQESLELVEVSNAISSVVDKVDSACIGITASLSTSNSSSSGSGVVYKKDGIKYYAITNYHVIEGADSIRAYITKSFSISATLEATYESHDLACISFEASDRYTVGTVDITGTLPVINPGETVIAIGCPLGISNYNYVTVGVASSTVVTSTGIDMFFHDAAINSGNSGGALFNIEGRLIGINFRKIVSDSENYMVEGMGEAIYIEEVLQFLETSGLL